MRIAITGGTGIIGKELQEMLPANFEGVILSREKEKDLLKKSKPSFTLVQTDYSIESLLNQLNECKAVVHLAAQRFNKSKTDTCFENVLIDFNLFKACEILDITNVIFTSTRGVYGNNPDVPWSEHHEASPENPYSLGKWVSEQTADYFNKYGMFIKSLRLAQVLSINARKSFMLGTFIENALRNDPLHVYASEDEKREYIYVKDVARGIMAALNKPKIKGVFNLGSGEIVSIPELARMINSAFKNSGKIIRHKITDPKTEYSLMESQLFNSTFEFQANWTIQEALVDMYKSFKQMETNDTFQ